MGRLSFNVASSSDTDDADKPLSLYLMEKIKR